LPSATTSLVRVLLIAHRLFKNPPCNPIARSTLPRPPHPAPNVRDDHDTPLSRAGMGKVLEMIWGARKGKYFCNEDWTGGISLIRFNKFGCARRRRSPDGRNTIRDGDTDEGHGFRLAQSGTTSASPRLCESCLAIPLIIQDYRPLDEARGLLIPSMLFAPFRPRTSHVMGFGSVLADRTSPKRVQKIWNGRAQSCPHRVERNTARRMQTHQSLLSLRQWLSARPRS
jgi:hypothetical protein